MRLSKAADLRLWTTMGVEASQEIKSIQNKKNDYLESMELG